MFKFVEKCKNVIYGLFKPAKHSAVNRENEENLFTNGNSRCYDTDTSSIKGVDSMNTVFDVANYILQKNGPMTTMKLQKLCYYAQSWSMAWDEKPLFNEEFQAWSNGPVCPQLFNTHRGIFSLGKNYYADRASGKFSKDELETINKVLEFYGDKSPQWLSDLTHNENPWKFARRGTPLGDPCDYEITKESMQQYYGGL